MTVLGVKKIVFSSDFLRAMYLRDRGHTVLCRVFIVLLVMYNYSLIISIILVLVIGIFVVVIVANYHYYYCTIAVVVSVNYEESLPRSRQSSRRTVLKRRGLC